MLAKIIDHQTIEVYDLTQFDPYAILHSGQVFRYYQTPAGDKVLSANHWAEIINDKNKIIIRCDDANYFYNYFDLGTNYQMIKSALDFPRLHNVIKAGGGIRILRGNFVEIVISFIISANNNIKRFTKTLNDLCEKYGTKLPNGDYAFPDLRQLSTLTASDFKQLGCGYRDQYLVSAIKQLSTLNFDELSALPTDESNRRLMQITGVGPKVAGCILLFAFHRYEVAPVDTWIKKAIAQLTPEEQKSILHGPYAGVAQQYIFYFLQHLHADF